MSLGAQVSKVRVSKFPDPIRPTATDKKNKVDALNNTVSEAPGSNPGVSFLSMRGESPNKKTEKIHGKNRQIIQSYYSGKGIPYFKLF